MKSKKKTKKTTDMGHGARQIGYLISPDGVHDVLIKPDTGPGNSQQNKFHNPVIAGQGKLGSGGNAHEDEVACFVAGFAHLEKGVKAATRNKVYLGIISRERPDRKTQALWNKTTNRFILHGHLKADSITVTHRISDHWQAIHGQTRLDIVPISRIKHGIHLFGKSSTGKASMQKRFPALFHINKTKNRVCQETR